METEKYSRSEESAEKGEPHPSDHVVISRYTDTKEMRRANSLYRRLFERVPRYRRLRGDLIAFEAKLTRYSSNVDGDGRAHLEAAKKLAENAWGALAACSINEGWKFLGAARREEVFLMDSRKLEAVANALAQEAMDKRKFPESNWRGKAIAELVAEAKHLFKNSATTN